MRVAIAIERFDPDGSSIEHSTALVADHLIARGHHVTLITGEAPPWLTLEGGTIVSGDTVDFRHRVSVKRFARWAVGALADAKADVTLSMTMACPATVVHPRSGVMAARIQREEAMRLMAGDSMRKRLMRMISPHPRALKRDRATVANKRVRCFVGNSYVIGQLAEHHGIGGNDGAARAVVIPDGDQVDVMTGDERAAVRRQIRDAFSVPDDAMALLFFAQHNAPLKGIEPLLRAVKSLVAGGRRITLLLAGHIGFAWHTYLSRLGLRDHVRMIGPTTQAARLIAAADLTVMPAFHDPAGHIVIQSLLMGVPAITTRFAGSREAMIAADGRSRGRLLEDPADVAALVAAIEAMHDPAQRQQCIDAMEGANEELSMSRHVDALEAVLREYV